MRRVSQNTEEGVEEGVTKVEALLSWLGVSHCHSVTVTQAEGVNLLCGM